MPLGPLSTLSKYDTTPTSSADARPKPNVQLSAVGIAGSIGAESDARGGVAATALGDPQLFGDGD